MLRGLGVGCFLETARGQPNEAAEIRFQPDGRIALLVGTQSNGQGHETSYPQIAAELFGLPIETFLYVQADTGVIATGGGHGGARSMHMGGAALVKAAELVIARAMPLAARLLQATPAEIVFADGRFATQDGRGVDLLAVARDAADPDTGETLDTRAENICDVFTFPSGCHVAEVEIDPATGAVTLDRYTAVDDFGTADKPAAHRRAGAGRRGAGHRPGAAGAHRIRSRTPASCSAAR